MAEWLTVTAGHAVTVQTLKSDDCSETVDAETSSMMHNDPSTDAAAATDAHDARKFTSLICPLLTSLWHIFTLST